MFGVARVMGADNRVALRAAASLAQVGEFAFVLAQQGTAEGILTLEQRALFIPISVGSMILTPFLMGAARRFVERLPPPHRAGKDGSDAEPGLVAVPGSSHVVIVGYGLNGRNVSRALRRLDVPFIVAEMNPGTVEVEREKGLPILYGDATREHVLEALGVDHAGAVVVAIYDPAATRQIVHLVRQRNATCEIFVRTRLTQEVDELHALGATAVVPEEFETSIELSRLIMQACGAPPHAVWSHQQAMRAGRYAALRDGSTTAQAEQSRRTLSELLLSMDVETVEIPAGAWGVGSSVRDLDVRGRTGASILAIVRGEETIQNPGASCVLQAEDVVVLVGKGAEVQAAFDLLRSRDATEGQYLRPRRLSEALPAVPDDAEG
jgi:CPA2 family monovalent cation:H+ antiporter-2